MKIFGASLVICAFVYAGFSMSARLRDRLLFWERFITAIEVIRTEICFSHSDIKSAFLSAARISGQDIFSRAAQDIERDGLESAWNKAVRDGAFCAEDRSLLLLFSSKLGKTDEEGQRRHIDHIRSLAAKTAERAAEDHARRGTLFRRGAALLGVFTVLILL